MADQAEAGDVGQSVNGKAAVGCWLLAVRKNVVGRWSLVVGCGAWLRGADEGVRPYVVRGDHFGGGLVQSRHGLYRGINPSLLRDTFFDGGRDHAGSERLRE